MEISSSAEHGIIYIDEIDKITRKSENPSITSGCIRRGCSAGIAEDSLKEPVASMYRLRADESTHIRS